LDLFMIHRKTNSKTANNATLMFYFIQIFLYRNAVKSVTKPFNIHKPKIFTYQHIIVKIKEVK